MVKQPHNQLPSAKSDGWRSVSEVWGSSRLWELIESPQYGDAEWVPPKSWCRWKPSVVPLTGAQRERTSASRDSKTPCPCCSKRLVTQPRPPDGACKPDPWVLKWNKLYRPISFAGERNHTHDSEQWIGLRGGGGVSLSGVREFSEGFTKARAECFLEFLIWFFLPRLPFIY